MRVSDVIERLVREEEGGSMVEYALVAVLIAAACAATVALIAPALVPHFQTVAAALP